MLAWVPAALIMAVIFWRSAQPGQAFVSDPTADLAVKKIGHFVGYALLGAALAIAIGSSRATWSAGVRGGTAAALDRAATAPGRAAAAPDRATLLGAWAIATAYAATDEFHQVFVTARSPSIVDVGIDALGAATGIATFAVLVRWWRRRTS